MLAKPLDSSKGMPPTLLPELSNINSLGEEIQRTFSDVKVVKTLNTMWNGLMVAPDIIKGHHQVIHVYYGKVVIELWTFAINGLSENDFILASKIDKL